MMLERRGSGAAGARGEARSNDGLAELDVRWADIDVRLARAQPRLLIELRDAVLLETRQSTRLSRFLRFVWDDVDACVTLTMDDFEGMRYARALRHYLEGVGYEPAIETSETTPRSGTADDLPEAIDPIEGLIELMLADRLAYTFYRKLSDRVVEPVLGELLERVAAQKLRRVAHAARLLGGRLRERDAAEPPVLDVSLQVRGFGGRWANEIDIATPDRIPSIRALAARIERLYGVPIEDQMHDSA